MIQNSIIIPVFGNEKLVHNLLQTLIPTLDSTCEVIVVDDGHPDIKINPANLPKEIIYLSNDHNVGYSAAVNRGIDLAHGEYITTINSDILLDKNWLEETRASFEVNPAIGMLGAKLVYPTDGRIMHAGTFFGESFCFNAFRMSLAEDPIVNEKIEVPALCDALVTMRKNAVLEVGKYDETYLTSVEDLEMSFRMRQIGLRNIYNPKIIGYHKTAASKEHRYKHVDKGYKHFFKKWNSFITDDTYAIFSKSLQRGLSSEKDMPQEAYIINLNRKNSKETLDRFIQLTKIKVLALFDYTEYVTGVPKYVQKASIDLLEVLPYTHLNLRYPIIYIVDHFVSLEDNAYWSLNRRNPHDLVFDYAFNLYFLKDVVKSKLND